MLELAPKAAAFWLGSMFLYTGAAKLAAGRGRPDAGALSLLPRPVRPPVGRLLPWVELGTGGLLLTGVFPWGPALAAGLGLGFFIVGLLGLLRRARVPCGCAGPGRERLGPTTLARAATIVGAAGLLLAVGPDGFGLPWPAAVSGAAAGLRFSLTARRQSGR